MLEEAGVSLLDIAGAGGTTWTKITRFLKNESSDTLPECFDSWGTPTADALVAIHHAVKKSPIIASGGIRSGIEIAKALALGADFTGMALPLVAPAMQSAAAVKKKIEGIITELKMAMFSCGTVSIDQLKSERCIRPVPSSVETGRRESPKK
jgi:isopentenyl-diphosphate delta-isomerase